VMPVVGNLDPGTSEARENLTAAFRKGLDETGYVEERGDRISLGIETSAGLQSANEDGDPPAIWEGCMSGETIDTRAFETVAKKPQTAVYTKRR